MTEIVKIKIYSSGKSKDSNLYSTDHEIDNVNEAQPVLKAIKLDLQEIDLSRVYEFPEFQEYAFINDFVDYRFEGFEIVPTDKNEYYFCFNQIIVSVKSEKFDDVFRHFDGEPLPMLEIDLGVRTTQGEEISTSELEFNKFSYETVD